LSDIQYQSKANLNQGSTFHISKFLIVEMTQQFVFKIIEVIEIV